MDHYERLGVSRGASEREVRSAYRRLARALHPDKEGGDVEEMAALNAAYAALQDPERRRAYDASLLGDPLASCEPSPPVSPRYQPRLARVLLALTLTSLITLIILNKRSPNQRQLTQELSAVRPLVQPHLDGALKRGEVPSLEEALSDPRAALLSAPLQTEALTPELTPERCLERFPAELQRRE